jgi:hypothetical protein
MPRIRYDNVRINDQSRAIITQANTIIRGYAAEGFDLTLRQLYYQFIARNLFPDSWQDSTTGSTNNERSYKKLGVIIADGRMAGLIDWDAITDRTRTVKEVSHWSSPESILQSCAHSFRIDKWASQPNHVEIFVEKDAMLGVIENVCEELDVPYFACRGYSSISALWEAGHKRMRPKMLAVRKRKLCVLYLGDHDPSGIDMDRDVRDRLTTFLGDIGDKEFEVARLALNMDQIEQYEPPPNPVKATDSRSAAYRERFDTDNCWELDALDPPVIVELIREAVIERRDELLWDSAVEEENLHRARLAKTAHHWDEVSSRVDDMPEVDEEEDES